MILEILSAVGFGFGFTLTAFAILFVYLSFFERRFDNGGLMGILSFVMLALGSSMLYLIIG